MSKTFRYFVGANLIMSCWVVDTVGDTGVGTAAIFGIGFYLIFIALDYIIND